MAAASKGRNRMAKAEKNAEREHRIAEEIIVDAYGPEEQSLGWYYYLKDTLYFPFAATCISERAISPLRKGDEVDRRGNSIVCPGKPALWRRSGCLAASFSAYGSDFNGPLYGRAV